MTDYIRRRVLQRAAGLGLTGLLGASSWKALGAASITLPFVNGDRPLTTAFPQKGTMILQRTRPPLLETPFEVFDQGVFTPNDRFYVRWHLANIPTEIDPAVFRLKVYGHVGKAIELTLDDLVEQVRAGPGRCSQPVLRQFARILRAACRWARNGLTARWEMPAGPACASRTCLTAPVSSAGAVAVRL